MKFKLFKNEQIVATTEQNFSFNLNADVKDKDGNINWNVKKKFLSWGSDLEIMRMTKNISVDGLDTLWMALILNEIDEANNNREVGNN